MSSFTDKQRVLLKDWVNMGPTAGGQFLGHIVELESRNGTEATYKVICPDGSIYVRYKVFPVPHKSKPYKGFFVPDEFKPYETEQCVVWL
jgi:hypothetical protein